MMNLSIKILFKTCLQTLWKLVQLFLFIIIVPPLINYASLKREAPLLKQHGRQSSLKEFFVVFILQVYRMISDMDRNCFYVVEDMEHRQVLLEM